MTHYNRKYNKYTFTISEFEHVGVLGKYSFDAQGGSGLGKKALSGFHVQVMWKPDQYTTLPEDLKENS